MSRVRHSRLKLARPHDAVTGPTLSLLSLKHTLFICARTARTLRSNNLETGTEKSPVGQGGAGSLGRYSEKGLTENEAARP